MNPLHAARWQACRRNRLHWQPRFLGFHLEASNNCVGMVRRKPQELFMCIPASLLRSIKSQSCHMPGKIPGKSVWEGRSVMPTSNSPHSHYGNPLHHKHRCPVIVICPASVSYPRAPGMNPSLPGKGVVRNISATTNAPSVTAEYFAVIRLISSAPVQNAP